MATVIDVGFNNKNVKLLPTSKA